MRRVACVAAVVAVTPTRLFSSSFSDGGDGASSSSRGTYPRPSGRFGNTRPSTGSTGYTSRTARRSNTDGGGSASGQASRHPYNASQQREAAGSTTPASAHPVTAKPVEGDVVEGEQPDHTVEMEEEIPAVQRNVKNHYTNLFKPRPKPLSFTSSFTEEEMKPHERVDEMAASRSQHALGRNGGRAVAQPSVNRTTVSEGREDKPVARRQSSIQADEDDDNDAHDTQDASLEEQEQEVTRLYSKDELHHLSRRGERDAAASAPRSGVRRGDRVRKGSAAVAAHTQAKARANADVDVLRAMECDEDEDDAVESVNTRRYRAPTDDVDDVAGEDEVGGGEDTSATEEAGSPGATAAGTVEAATTEDEVDDDDGEAHDNEDDSAFQSIRKHPFYADLIRRVEKNMIRFRKDVRASGRYSADAVNECVRPLLQLTDFPFTTQQLGQMTHAINAIVLKNSLADRRACRRLHLYRSPDTDLVLDWSVEDFLRRRYESIHVSWEPMDVVYRRFGWSPAQMSDRDCLVYFAEFGEFVELAELRMTDGNKPDAVLIEDPVAQADRKPIPASHLLIRRKSSVETEPSLTESVRLMGQPALQTPQRGKKSAHSRQPNTVADVFAAVEQAANEVDGDEATKLTHAMNVVRSTDQATRPAGRTIKEFSVGHQHARQTAESRAHGAGEGTEGSSAAGAGQSQRYSPERYDAVNAAYHRTKVEVSLLRRRLLSTDSVDQASMMQDKLSKARKELARLGEQLSQLRQQRREEEEQQQRRAAADEDEEARETTLAPGTSARQLDKEDTGAADDDGADQQQDSHGGSSDADDAEVGFAIPRHQPNYPEAPEHATAFRKNDDAAGDVDDEEIDLALAEYDRDVQGGAAATNAAAPSSSAPSWSATKPAAPAAATVDADLDEDVETSDAAAEQDEEQEGGDDDHRVVAQSRRDDETAAADSADDAEETQLMADEEVAAEEPAASTDTQAELEEVVETANEEAAEDVKTAMEEEDTGVTGGGSPPRAALAQRRASLSAAVEQARGTLAQLETRQREQQAEMERLLREATDKLRGLEEQLATVEAEEAELAAAEESAAAAAAEKAAREEAEAKARELQERREAELAAQREEARLAQERKRQAEQAALEMEKELLRKLEEVRAQLRGEAAAFNATKTAEQNAASSVSTARTATANASPEAAVGENGAASGGGAVREKPAAPSPGAATSNFMCSPEQYDGLHLAADRLRKEITTLERQMEEEGDEDDETLMAVLAASRADLEELDECIASVQHNASWAAPQDAKREKERSLDAGVVDSEAKRIQEEIDEHRFHISLLEKRLHHSTQRNTMSKLEQRIIAARREISRLRMEQDRLRRAGRDAYGAMGLPASISIAETLAHEVKDSEEKRRVKAAMMATESSARYHGASSNSADDVGGDGAESGVVGTVADEMEGAGAVDEVAQTAEDGEDDELAATSAAAVSAPVDAEEDAAEDLAASAATSANRVEAFSEDDDEEEAYFRDVAEVTTVGSGAGEGAAAASTAESTTTVAQSDSTSAVEKEVTTEADTGVTAAIPPPSVNEDPEARRLRLRLNEMLSNIQHLQDGIVAQERTTDYDDDETEEVLLEMKRKLSQLLRLRDDVHRRLLESTRAQSTAVPARADSAAPPVTPVATSATKPAQLVEAAKMRAPRRETSARAATATRAVPAARRVREMAKLKSKGSRA